MRETPEYGSDGQRNVRTIVLTAVVLLVDANDVPQEFCVGFQLKLQAL